LDDICNDYQNQIHRYQKTEANNQNETDELIITAQGIETQLGKRGEHILLHYEKRSNVARFRW